ncbi:hypothetical protein PIB30_016916 [Stylosanthes scabra]|uniref:Uncharacterized protein n=1 Tax=Stylosanthes scabra TaxID=79078 RepID=A0ABU6W5P0_9FABA|nr:hypothetical protein [Stylosanthes scabra]
MESSKVFVLMCLFSSLFFTYVADATNIDPFEAQNDATKQGISTAKVLEIIPAARYYYVLGEGGSSASSSEGQVSKCDQYCIIGIIKFCCDSYSLPRKMAKYA